MESGSPLCLSVPLRQVMGAVLPFEAPYREVQGEEGASGGGGAEGGHSSIPRSEQKPVPEPRPWGTRPALGGRGDGGHRRLSLFLSRSSQQGDEAGEHQAFHCKSWKWRDSTGWWGQGGRPEGHLSGLESGPGAWWLSVPISDMDSDALIIT